MSLFFFFFSLRGVNKLLSELRLHGFRFSGSVAGGFLKMMKNKGFGYWSSRRGERNQGPAGPSPVVPLFFLLVASAVVVARMVMRYQGWSLFGTFMKRQNNVTTLFLLPLLLVFAVSLIPSFQKWRNGTGARSSAISSSSNANSSSSSFLDWNYSTNATNSTAANSNGQYQDDGTGIGLFIFLIFVLLLFPWR